MQSGCDTTTPCALARRFCDGGCVLAAAALQRCLGSIRLLQFSPAAMQGASGSQTSLPGRLELPTLRLTASRSNQLSYGSPCVPGGGACGARSRALGGVCGLQGGGLPQRQAASAAPHAAGPAFVAMGGCVVLVGLSMAAAFSARCYVSVRCSRARAGGAQVRCRQPGLAQVRVRSSARSVAVSWSCCACGSCAAAPARCCALRAAIPVGLGRWGAVFSSGFVSRWLCGVALRVQGRRSQIEAAQAGAQTCLMRSRPHCSSLACRRYLGARPGALRT